MDNRPSAVPAQWRAPCLPPGASWTLLSGQSLAGRPMAEPSHPPTQLAVSGQLLAACGAAGPGPAAKPTPAPPGFPPARVQSRVSVWHLWPVLAGQGRRCLPTARHRRRVRVRDRRLAAAGPGPPCTQPRPAGIRPGAGRLAEGLHRAWRGRLGVHSKQQRTAGCRSSRRLVPSPPGQQPGSPVLGHWRRPAQPSWVCGTQGCAPSMQWRNGGAALASQQPVHSTTRHVVPDAVPAVTPAVVNPPPPP